MIAALFASYLIGSIPTGFLLIKATKKIDIRTTGSGNVGATNALRAGGLKAGLSVLILDIAKGVIASALIPVIFITNYTRTDMLACGLLAVIGHNFPCFLKFRGGKGVATTIGVLAVSSPLVTLIIIIVWMVLFFCFRYVSIGSIAAAIAIPVSFFFTGHGNAEISLGSALAILMIARHHTNIRRLLDGTENRVWTKKQGNRGSLIIRIPD
jgi:acyl phosphate:glycerol-3-phosphate acyltransferase